MTSAAFETNPHRLQTILEDARNGKVQLPDFQRGWVWDDERIRGLLASIAASFPIGTIMTLEAGGQDIKFKARSIEGTDIATDKNLETFLLDGQQRITSLYQSLMGDKPVTTKDSKNKKISRFYYISMTEPDLEKAIVAVSAKDRIQREFGGSRLDLSTPEREYEQFMFPVNKLFSSKRWRREYDAHWDHNKEKSKFYDDFEERIIERFTEYHVPIIKLGKDTPKEAVCLIFEKVNTGGMSLTVFELLTATFAADEFNLRKDWEKREERLKDDESRILEKPDKDHFLQAVSLLVTFDKRSKDLAKHVAPDRATGISCKRRDILKLKVDEYKEWAPEVENGFIHAARFLNDENIFSAKSVPYPTQLVPLAAIFATLGRDINENVRKKISRWYWSGVLGELYGGAIETRFTLDLPQVVEFARDKDAVPKTISDAHFDPKRLGTLRTKNSAAYKGIYALLMRSGCQDFRTGKRIGVQIFHNDAIDIHHIFPKQWCKMQKPAIPKDFYDSVVNKTAISSKTNQTIDASAPSAYLKKIESESSAQIDKSLVSHGIDLESIRTDNFYDFFKARAEHLLKIIEEATGMKINRDEQPFDSNSPMDEDYIEDNDE